MRWGRSAPSSAGGLFIAFGNHEDKVQLVVLGVLRSVDGGVDLAYLELPVELAGS